MNFSASSLLASFVFGVFGLWAFRRGKSSSSAHYMLIGIAMMLYTYFTHNVYLDWGIGAGLGYLLYRFKDTI